uniref:Uncharacterized protein n=1 Tax=Thermosporothrix sp. COM3 TaxID=2490863 RepID=A0A455SJU6_9CHLR|nr:hypothetical protein KTC_26310 [Thermosporothrix sp. COM3]
MTCQAVMSCSRNPKGTKQRGLFWRSPGDKKLTPTDSTSHPESIRNDKGTMHLFPPFIAP